MPQQDIAQIISDEFFTEQFKNQKICGKCYYCRGRFMGDAYYCVHDSTTVVGSTNFVLQQVCSNDPACVSYKSIEEQIKLGNVVSQSPKQFILVQDNSDAWYVIPSDKREDWLDWLNSDEIEQGCIPFYADRVGGHPCKVTFQNYRIDHVCCGLGG